MADVSTPPRTMRQARGAVPSPGAVQGTPVRRESLGSKSGSATSRANQIERLVRERDQAAVAHEEDLLLLHHQHKTALSAQEGLLQERDHAATAYSTLEHMVLEKHAEGDRQVLVMMMLTTPKTTPIAFITVMRY